MQGILYVEHTVRRGCGLIREEEEEKGVPLILKSCVHEIKVTFASSEGCGVFGIVIEFRHSGRIVSSKLKSLTVKLWLNLAWNWFRSGEEEIKGIESSF